MLSPLTTQGSPGRLLIGSVAFDPVTCDAATTHIRDSITRGIGGRVVVLAHEQLRHLDGRPALRTSLDDATLVLAGSAGAVWASRVAGTPLPERITPTAMADALCSASVVDGRRVYLVGGAPGGRGIPSGAQRAAAVLGLRHRGLRIAGCSAPAADLATDSPTRAALISDLVEAKPDVILVDTDQASAHALAVTVRPELTGSWIFSSGGVVRAIVGDAYPRRRGADVTYTATLLARAAVARVSGPRRPL